jgi:hypothetical protein
MSYESGGVPPHQRDVMNKCVECGAIWCGPARAVCGECAEPRKCTCAGCSGRCGAADGNCEYCCGKACSGGEE